MEFPKITEEEAKIAFEEGLDIYGKLRKKYPQSNCIDLDIILNSLCHALVRLTKLNVNEEDHKIFYKLICDIIYLNLKLDKK